VFGISELGVVDGHAQVNVTKNTTILPGTVFTLSAAGNLARDLNFNATISGNVWYNCTATNRLTPQSCNFNCRYSERHQSYGEAYQNLKNMLTCFRRLT
jgi:hypothetical protein